MSRVAVAVAGAFAVYALWRSGALVGVMALLSAICLAIAVIWVLIRADYIDTRWIMDILNRLTDKAQLNEMMRQQRGSASRQIDEATLADHLKGNVFGQNEVCDDVAQQIRTRYAKTRRSKPVGVFMLPGPPATGKTHFAKELARGLSAQATTHFLPIEMSQYSQGVAAQTLFGAPRGIQGSDQYGILTGALLQTPSCVVLLDEFEKASSELQTRFLSAWNDGYITDNSTGERISTTDAIFVLTTNAAQKKVTELCQSHTDRDELSDACKKALQDHFKPEVLSRIDRVFPFKPLEGMDIARVVASQMEASIQEYDLQVEKVDPGVLFDAVEEVHKKSADPREIARMLEKKIDRQAADLMEQGAHHVRVRDDEGAIVLERVA
jgi:ATP-dependent Clp protease ATP-binding subunit ClpA